MLKSKRMGELNSQINQGEAIKNQLSYSSDLPFLQSLEEKYLNWKESSSYILKNGFTSDFQQFYQDFNKTVYLGNVQIGENSFEGIRERLNKQLPHQLECLNNLKSTLQTIPNDKLLPIDQVIIPNQQFTNNSNREKMTDNKKNVPQCDYVIITALETDEMEKVLDFIEIEGQVANDKHLIEYGSLKSNSSKKIAFASQQSTGMIDASILSTELLILFRPKYLIMVGVLGGKPGEVNIGDVVIATKVFTIDKGKISELGFKKEIEGGNVDGAHITKLIRNREKIIDFIKHSDSTRQKRINIHFGPIGCVRQIIDLEGFFKEVISAEDRKTLALEMESYGVKRACELVNDGKTSPLIVKSAMDNTVDKVDEAKTYAAWTSAMVVKYALENNLI
jgi:nucleoside phosphorylase